MVAWPALSATSNVASSNLIVPGPLASAGAAIRVRANNENRISSLFMDFSSSLVETAGRRSGNRFLRSERGLSQEKTAADNAALVPGLPPPGSRPVPGVEGQGIELNRQTPAAGAAGKSSRLYRRPAAGAIVSPVLAKPVTM